MKYIFALVSLSISSLVMSQSSEDLIPRDAVTVFTFNNVSLFKKVSMDELVKYAFMSEVQSELFDGSTNGKTLKDSGIDFEQKLNVFYGLHPDFEIAGFTFGIKDKKELFQVFDDFDKVETNLEGVEVYSSYFNHLIIRGNAGIVLRVDPSDEKVSTVTDSIWLARGYGYFYDSFEDDYDGEYDEEYEIEIDETDGLDDYDVVVPNDYSPQQNDIIEIESDEIPTNDSTATEDAILNKTYWELNDSINSALQLEYLDRIVHELIVEDKNLKKMDAKFANQLTHSSDGIFYLDNSRNVVNRNNLMQFEALFPELFNDMKDLYTGNVMLGDLNLNQNSIDLNFEANYGDQLGQIYSKLNSAKFDKNVLKYIHQNSTGFFTYNINMKEGYNQAYDIIIPILREEKDPRISSNVLMAELINEFVDTDALFDTYKGSMFGSFNGIKKVKTTRIEFYYDEETFEYGEKEIIGEEDMPVFTLGFSTNRSDIPDKVLKHFARMTSRFKNMGTYWMVEDAVLNSLPLYIINRNGLMIFTNDEDLAVNHANGYGKESLSGKRAKSAQNSKFMYGHFDWGVALSNLPREMFNTKQNEILDTMRGKTGVIELTSSKTTQNKTNFKLSYAFEGEYENAGKYVLDLVNSVYVLSK